MTTPPTTDEPDTPAPVVTELTARRLGPVRRYFAEHPRGMDAVVMVLFGVPHVLVQLLVAIEPAPEGVGAGGDRATGVVLIGAAGVVALNWRRRRPVLVAAVMTLLEVLGLAAVGRSYDTGVAFALYAVAASRRPRVTWTTFVLTTVAATAAATVFPNDTGSGVLVLSLLAVAIGTSVRNRRLHVAKIVERTNALARDRDQHARLARVAERTRIAREMHDVVAHSLAVMIALADGARATLEPDPARSRAALREVSETGRSALADMRRVLGVLREPDAPFEPQPGSTDLPRLVERFRTAGLDVRAEGLDLVPTTDAGRQLAVHRIVSEALTNALRHAPGTGRVDLVVRRTGDAVEVDVRDEGAPGTPPPTAALPGSGLIGMAERAAVYGGTVEAGPSGTGWHVHAVVPWDEEGAA